MGLGGDRLFSVNSSFASKVSGPKVQGVLMEFRHCPPHPKGDLLGQLGKKTVINVITQGLGHEFEFGGTGAIFRE